MYFKPKIFLSVFMATFTGAGATGAFSFGLGGLTSGLLLGAWVLAATDSVEEGSMDPCCGAAAVGGMKIEFSGQKGGDFSRSSSFSTTLMKEWVEMDAAAFDTSAGGC